jgi:C-terminal processing protease CtpA/Prc
MKKLLSKFYFAAVCCALALLPSAASFAQQPTVSKTDRDRGQVMLKTIREDIKKYYYDENLRGIDIDARFKLAGEQIEKANSLGQIMGIIAQAVVEFDDSHTRFIPPQRSSRTEYGWKMNLVGERAFVTAVKPGSDAEAKGLRIGDEIFSIDGFAPTRETLWKIKYYYYSLRPQPVMRLNIIRPNGKQEEIIVLAKITQGKRVVDMTGMSGGGADIWDLIRRQESESYLRRHRYTNLGEDVFIWKMPQFDLADVEVDNMMEKTRKYPALIMDLRGNGGGAVKTLNRLIGHFFDRDIKIADWKGRKEFDPQIAKSRGDKHYKGKVIVLIDSESGSASEIFARIMQLEKRGTILGDRSAGAVMMSRFRQRQLGVDTVSFYGSNITEADVIMSDGKSLEKIGVTPDEAILPTGADLAAKKDIVMARALALAGLKMSAEETGKMFPIEWEK